MVGQRQDESPPSKKTTTIVYPRVVIHPVCDDFTIAILQMTFSEAFLFFLAELLTRPGSFLRVVRHHQGSCQDMKFNFEIYLMLLTRNAIFIPIVLTCLYPSTLCGLVGVGGGGKGES